MGVCVTQVHLWDPCLQCNGVMGVIDGVRGAHSGIQLPQEEAPPRPSHGGHRRKCLPCDQEEIYQGPKMPVLSLDTLSYRATRVLEAMLTKREEAIFPE